MGWAENLCDWVRWLIFISVTSDSDLPFLYAHINGASKASHINIILLKQVEVYAGKSFQKFLGIKRNTSSKLVLERCYINKTSI